MCVASLIGMLGYKRGGEGAFKRIILIFGFLLLLLVVFYFTREISNLAWVFIELIWRRVPWWPMVALSKPASATLLVLPPLAELVRAMVP